MKRRFVGSVVAFCVLFGALAGNAFAQQFATLRVTVNDPTGAAVPGAAISLKSTTTGAERTAVTGGTGLAVLAGVPAGPYQLTVSGKDFKPSTQPVQLSVGQVASVGVQLGLEVRQEQVEVQETAQGIDPEKSDISQVIETRKIADLPISGRDFIDFVLLTPSVNVGRSTAVGAQSPFTETVLKLSFAGTRESHTSFFALDGIDYGTSISGVQRISPSQDWVQEFRVADSPFNADTGRNLGSVVNTITKSGTNDLHGTVYEFFRNSALDAKNVLSAPGFTAFRFNQFGGTLGGPLRKEKNFFFVGYEGQRRAESPLYSSFILHFIDSPPACPINGVGVAPVFPCISINATKRYFGLQPEVLGSVLSLDNYDKFFAKVDNVLSNRTYLNVGYLFNDSRKTDVRGAAPGEGLPSSYRDNPVRDQTVYANLVHNFSPHWTSQAALQFGRRTFHLEPKGAGLEPAISIPNLLSGGGFVGSVRFYREQRAELTENMTYTHGNHTFKFGGDIQPVWTNAQVPLFSPGFGVFCPDGFFGTNNLFGCRNASVTGPLEEVFLYLEPSQFFGQPIPARTLPFTTGLFNGPAGAQFDQSTRFSYVHKLYGFYLQDQWRARPNLTFTLGVRYDVDVLPSAADTKTTGNFHPTDYSNVQPRAAFAYSFRGGKDVLRGGFGIFTAPFVYSDILVSWIGASEFQYMFSSNVGPFGPPLLPEFSDPTHQLIGFGASGAVGLPSGIFPGPCPACTPSAFFNFATTGAYPTPIGPFPLEFPLGYAKRDFPNPYSEMASLELEHQLAKGWFLSADYQFLHAMRLPVYDSVNGLPNGRDAFGVPLPCAPTGSVAPTPVGKDTFCPADPRFGFVLYVHPIGFSIYHAGTLSLRKAFSHHYSILANYTWSKSIDIETTVNLPNSPQDYLHPNLDRAVGDNDIRHRLTLAILGESPKSWPRALRDFKSSILFNAQSARFFSINTGFDTNGDLFPFNDRVGTIGRNTYKGDPYYNMDMRIQRVIPFSERVKGEFSAEFFNLFNTVNIEDVNNIYGAPDFIGPVPKQFGDGITTPAGFGTPKFAAPARQIQFSIRLNF